MCCSPRGHKGLDTLQRPNGNNKVEGAFPKHLLVLSPEDTIQDRAPRPRLRSSRETPRLGSVRPKYKCFMRMFSWESDLPWSDFPQGVVVKGSIKGKSWREFPGGPVVRTWHFYFWGWSSICGCRTKVLQAASHDHKKQKQIRNEETACGGENSEMRRQRIQRSV